MLIPRPSRLADDVFNATFEKLRTVLARGGARTHRSLKNVLRGYKSASNAVGQNWRHNFAMNVCQAESAALIPVRQRLVIDAH